MKIPNEAEPVLARIERQGSLGKSTWSEVVYHNGFKWRSFAGSDTFNDGEQVVAWEYISNLDKLLVNK